MQNMYWVAAIINYYLLHRLYWEVPKYSLHFQIETHEFPYIADLLNPVLTHVQETGGRKP